jgi:two-component system copper resistance phosphate regulon response regulator CusR
MGAIVRRRTLDSRTMRILFAEDDERLREAIVRGLREHAFAVDAVGDGATAIAKAASNDYDVVVLDILMAGRDGLDVCRELRKRGLDAPILLLTALDELTDKIAGLDAGADDYLTKPFAFEELLARLRALMRRRRGDVVPATIVVGDLEVDTHRRTVRRGPRTIPLTAKEFSFLEYLARNSGRVVTRAEITTHVWDDNHEPGANLLDVYVSRLRRKVDAAGERALLHTRRGMGVMLAAQDPRLPPVPGAE